jgi:hypothetical protein
MAMDTEGAAVLANHSRAMPSTAAGSRADRAADCVADCVADRVADRACVQAKHATRHSSAARWACRSSLTTLSGQVRVDQSPDGGQCGGNRSAAERKNQTREEAAVQQQHQRIAEMLGPASAHGAGHGV